MLKYRHPVFVVVIMVFLLLAILCSTLISIGMRLSSGKVRGRFSMLAVNYLICSLLGACYADFSCLSAQTEGIALTAGLSVLNGALLLGGFLLLQVSLRKNGVVLSSLFMKLGLLVPFLVSAVCFGELPTGLQILGFCIAVGAIVLFNLQKTDGNDRFDLGLIVLLLVCGGSDAMIKIFEALGPALLSNHFLCFSFTVAFVLCALIVVVKKERPDVGALGFGTAIGVANFFSSKLLLAALTQLPAVVVFPTFSVAVMLIVTACGVVFFRERLDKLRWAAFGAIIVALAMLNI